MANFLSLQTVETVLEIISGLQPLETQEVPLNCAVGRVLGEDFISPEDLPGFARSTVDGFAVQARDVFGASEASPALLDLVGECVMGEAPDFALLAGQSARIWTGGMLPQGADSVVMLEYSRSAGAKQIELTSPVAPLDNVLGKDDDTSSGELLLASGSLISAQNLALLAALGQTDVTVRRKPRFGVISSGDEVVPLGELLTPGKVRESNSHMLCAMLENWGAETENLGLVRDDVNELSSLLESGLEKADCVLVSGGSSAGQRDFTFPAIKSLPGWEVLVHGIAISPGKPTIVARNGNKMIWGLPGNPSAAFVTAFVFIRELIAVLLGQQAPSTKKQLFKARLVRRVSSTQGRRDYIRVRLEYSYDDDFPLAHPLLGPSGLISNPATADALVVCHENMEGLEAGALVPVLLLRPQDF